MKPAFRDRPHAGRELARMLDEFRGSAALVLAIPAGGVPVAAAIAQELGLPLDVVPVSKVLYPWTTEAGYGAVAFDGSVLLDEAAIESRGVKPAQVEKAVAGAREKVERRLARLRAGRPPLALSGQTVIVVDDGIAAGSTMRAAIAALRRQGAGKIVVAVPTAHKPTLDAISKLADETFCANVRAGGGSFAVADAYEEWRDLPDEEIQALLENRVR
ncbi:MAG TPA: phosphoribosyltransferase family protein [Burkholderiales bacterium]